MYKTGDKINSIGQLLDSFNEDRDRWYQTKQGTIFKLTKWEIADSPKYVIKGEMDSLVDITMHSWFTFPYTIIADPREKQETEIQRVTTIGPGEEIVDTAELERLRGIEAKIKGLVNKNEI